MATFRRHDAVIAFEDTGDGCPVLLLAPGGLRSHRALWEESPWDPRVELVGDYRLIAMDQRNAGDSTAPIRSSDHWQDYADDQLGLLDALGIETCHVIGMCIGGPFISRLLTIAPDRFRSAVVIQPTGLHDNRDAKVAALDGWIAEVRDQHPETTADDWMLFRAQMLGDGILQSVDDAVLAAIRTPLLILAGADLYHPAEVSRRFAALVDGAELITDWRGDALPAADARIREFLAAHTPQRREALTKSHEKGAR